MPLRPVIRDLARLLLTTLDDLLPENHSARFVAAFVDDLARDSTQSPYRSIPILPELLAYDVLNFPHLQ